VGGILPWGRRRTARSASDCRSASKGVGNGGDLLDAWPEELTAPAELLATGPEELTAIAHVLRAWPERTHLAELLDAWPEELTDLAELLDVRPES
jgi:hypothetical protein